MNSKALKTLIGILIFGIGASMASAQSATPAIPGPQGQLGMQLRAIVAEHRDTTKALLESRKATLEALKQAAPVDRAALRLALRENMRAMQQNQRELAKAIRDAIKARRDLQRQAGGGG